MTAEEWKRAMTAPESELKTVLPLSPEQKEVAERFGITEEEYARGELARVYGQQRLEKNAARLGDIVRKMLSEVSPGSQLRAIVYEGVKFRWIFRVELPQGIRNVSVPRELVDDVLDFELFEAMQQLRNHLKASLAPEAATGD
jgi:hypothetical protein